MYDFPIKKRSSLLTSPKMCLMTSSTKLTRFILLEASHDLVRSDLILQFPKSQQRIQLNGAVRTVHMSSQVPFTKKVLTICFFLT